MTIDLDKILEIALREAEERFGPRNHQRNILAVVVYNGSPRIWYPDQQSILVKVNSKCQHELDSAYYQLGHEAVHILSPVHHADSTVLEKHWRRVSHIDSCVNRP